MSLPSSFKSILASLVFLAVSACTTSPTDRTVGTAIDDAAISTRVKAALAGDPDVKARDVQVETYRGTVQLSGFVDSPENARRASEVARRVDGVREVKNDLLVK